MFGPPGYAYVYLIYGMHCCLNAVTEAEGRASAVLIRALEPVANVNEPTNGPGRLCRAMAIDRRLDGIDLFNQDELWIAAPITKTTGVRRSTRIGITRAAQRLLRFYEAGSRFVSGPQRLRPS